MTFRMQTSNYRKKYNKNNYHVFTKEPPAWSCASRGTRANEAYSHRRTFLSVVKLYHTLLSLQISSVHRCFETSWQIVRGMRFKWGVAGMTERFMLGVCHSGSLLGTNRNQHINGGTPMTQEDYVILLTWVSYQMWREHHVNEGIWRNHATSCREVLRAYEECRKLQKIDKMKLFHWREGFFGWHLLKNDCFFAIVNYLPLDTVSKGVITERKRGLM